MQLKILGYFAQLARQHLHGFHRQTRIVIFVPFGTLVGRPIGLKRRLIVGQYGLIGVVPAIQRIAAGGDRSICIGFRNHAFAREPIRIHLARRGVRMNALVHQWLRHHRLILLVVAETPVAHQIDHRIPVEFHAVIQRNFSYKTNRFWIVAIDMKNRHFEHL